MANQKTMLQIEWAELAISVDNGRAAGDRFKLPAFERGILDTRLADLRAKDDATVTFEGGRVEASIKSQAALDKLSLYLHDGYNFIKGMGSYTIGEAERQGLFTHYGWAQGELGLFPNDRIETLANRAIAATPSVSNPAWQYPAPLLALITAELAALNTNQPIALGGNRQAAIAARDEALDLLQTMNDRVRFYYCFASDDEDRTQELAKIGRQPRRPPTYGGGMAAPSGLALTGNNDLTVSAEWDSIADADHYLLLVRRIGIDADYVEQPTTFSENAATVGPYPAGLTVRMKVRAVKNGTLSPESEVAEVTLPAGGAPAAPGAPMLTIGPDGQIVVTWTPVAGASLYNVYRLIIGTDSDYVLASLASGTSLTLIDMPIGATVRVRLTAINANGESLPGPHAEIVVMEVP